MDLASPILFVVCLAVYISTRSIGLDDWDSFNFARAIDRFDVRLNQPHPPGYPVYVLMARLLNLAAHDHLLTLTLLSGASGALAVLAFQALGRDLGVPWCGPLLAAMPLFWLSSEMALSDVPGLLFVIVAVFLFARAVLHASPSSKRGGIWRWEAFSIYLLSGSAVSGLAAGVRPQDALVPLAVLTLYVWPQSALSAPAGRRLRRFALDAAGSLLAFALACLTWAIPLTLTFPSVRSALDIYQSQASYVASTDSLLARPLTAPNVLARLAEFGSAYGAYFGGPRQGGLAAFFALAAAAALLVLICRPGRVRHLVLVWLLPYAGFMLLTMRPDDPRKILPTIPPLLLLLAAVFAPRRDRASLRLLRYVPALVPVGLSAFFLVRAIPLIRTLDSVPAPPIQAAEYIRANFQPTDSLIVAGLSYNAVRYLAPGYPTYFLDAFNEAGFQRDLASGAYRHIILLDKEGPALPETWVGTASQTFRREPLVLPKASEVWLAVYEPLSDLRPQQFALPPGPVHIGTREDVRYLLDGWYRPEEIAHVAARWTGQKATVRFWVGQPTEATLTLVGVSFQAGQRLSVALNGQVVEQLPISQDWAPYNIALTATLFRPEAMNTITLEHSVVKSAFDASQGQSLDRRPLAVAYSSFELKPR